MAKSIAATASSSVAGKRSMMSDHAEVRYWRDLPKSPTSACRTKSPNWTASGRSKPMAFRNCSTSALLASCGSITTDGSPVKRTMKKTRARTQTVASKDCAVRVRR
jgi:hypothetical protein